VVDLFDPTDRLVLLTVLSFVHFLQLFTFYFDLEFLFILILQLDILLTQHKDLFLQSVDNRFFVSFVFFYIGTSLFVLAIKFSILIAETIEFFCLVIQLSLELEELVDKIFLFIQKGLISFLKARCYSLTILLESA